MSRLLKIYTNKESTVHKLRSKLYINGVSSIAKPKPQIDSYIEFRDIDEPILDLYIDSDQEAEAMSILNDFTKKLA